MPNPLTASAPQPDYEAFLNVLLRKGTPRRAHLIELLMDHEVRDEICANYRLLDGLDPADPHFDEQRMLRMQRFLGYDYVNPQVAGLEFPLHRAETEDTAGLQRSGGRSYVDENVGPITSWEEFERYPWPSPSQMDTRALEYFEKHLPDDMCVVVWGVGHFCELISWLLGYQTLCFKLYEQPDLVQAIADRLLEIDRVVLSRVLEFQRVKVIFASDDMGYKNGTLISPKDLRRYVFPGHTALAAMTHAAGRPYILHSCGNLARVMDDLIDDVKIDAKHSFEDTIEDIRQVKHTYGQRIGLLGGLDMDFLCRASQEQVRQRVRDTLHDCQPGGGYCLGTGNTVANYLNLDNYLAMIDEGRRWRG